MVVLAFQFEETEGLEGETCGGENTKASEEKNQYQVTMRRHTVGPGDCTHEQVTQPCIRQSVHWINVIV